MSLPRSELPLQISDRLNVLSAIVKARTRNNLTDASHTLEHIVARLFNVLFGWNLKNLNTEKANYPGVDLADRERRLAVQVTNNASSRKIEDTGNAVAKHGLSAEFSEMILFFLLPKKPSFPRNFNPAELGLKMDTWDIPDLVQKISEGDLDRLQSAAKVLAEEVPGFHLPAKEIAGDEAAPAKPTLVAKFKEINGELCLVRKGKCPEYGMDLWIEGAPEATRSVIVEVLDESFKDSPWPVKRKKKSARDFVTDDMSSYGDVAIVVRGFGREGTTSWTVESTLHQALLHYYRAHPSNPAIKAALQQIRDN